MLKKNEKKLFEQDWAREFPDDPQARTRFDLDPAWPVIYKDPVTRAAFVMWQAGRKSMSQEHDRYCITDGSGACISNDLRCMHRRGIE
jgi:hypothetical protein